MALDNSPPVGLPGSRLLREVTSTVAEGGAGVFVLFTMDTNNGLPKMAVIRVTDALMIATNTGGSIFLSGFFSRSGGGAAVPRRGVVCSFEGGEGGSE